MGARCELDSIKLEVEVQFRNYIRGREDGQYVVSANSMRNEVDCPCDNRMVTLVCAISGEIAAEERREG